MNPPPSEDPGVRFPVEPLGKVSDAESTAESSHEAFVPREEEERNNTVLMKSSSSEAEGAPRPNVFDALLGPLGTKNESPHEARPPAQRAGSPLPKRWGRGGKTSHEHFEAVNSFAAAYEHAGWRVVRLHEKVPLFIARKDREVLAAALRFYQAGKQGGRQAKTTMASLRRRYPEFNGIEVIAVFDHEPAPIREQRIKARREGLEQGGYKIYRTAKKCPDFLITDGAKLIAVEILHGLNRSSLRREYREKMRAYGSLYDNVLVHRDVEFAMVGPPGEPFRQEKLG